MRVNDFANIPVSADPLNGSVETPAALFRHRLSWERLDATECDVKRDLKLILCEQDFTSLCGTRWPHLEPQTLPHAISLQQPGDMQPLTVYFQGHDDDGNYVKVCVIRDTTTPH